MAFLLLYGFWLLFNGRITAEILLIGLPIVGLVWLICIRMGLFSARSDFQHFRRLPGYLLYLLFLLKEVLLSALRVMKRIWMPGLPESALVSFSPGLEREGCRVLLADSITLTPGTITVDAGPGKMLVHCLEAQSGPGLSDSAMLRKIQKLEEAGR